MEPTGPGAVARQPVWPKLSLEKSIQKLTVPVHVVRQMCSILSPVAPRREAPRNAASDPLGNQTNSVLAKEVPLVMYVCVTPPARARSLLLSERAETIRGPSVCICRARTHPGSVSISMCCLVLSNPSLRRGRPRRRRPLGWGWAWEAAGWRACALDWRVTCWLC